MKSVTKKSVLSYLKKNKQFFKEEFGVTYIGLFGSVSREEQTDKSDIDIIIEMEKDKKNIHNFLNFKRLLESQFGVKVDLGLKNSIKPAIKETIENELIDV